VALSRTSLLRDKDASAEVLSSRLGDLRLGSARRDSREQSEDDSVYQSRMWEKESPVMDYERLGRSGLKKILRSNPPDVPHYQKALDERKRRDQFWVLIVGCAGTLLTVLSLSFGGSKTLAAQVKQESWQRVLSANQQFENYKNDFIQFGHSPQAKRSRNTEDWTDVQLISIADQTVSHLEYVETMVAIYLKVSSKQDRLAIWPLITEQIGTTRKRLDQQVEVANLMITTLRTPGVVAETMHMRDDLRKAEEDLEGARKEIEAAEAKLQ
jgi:hypothetical protein